MSANRKHSNNHLWITPPEIPAALGSFDLDPCADVDQPWSHATVEWTIQTDGLSRDWFGRVWLNPPYGQETAKWLARLATHGRGTALVFARTDTRMFHEIVWPRASGLLFLEGRPHFYYPSGDRAKGNSGGPLVLIAYGQKDAIRLRDADIAGAYVPINEATDE